MRYPVRGDRAHFPGSSLSPRARKKCQYQTERNYATGSQGSAFVSNHVGHENRRSSRYARTAGRSAGADASARRGAAVATALPARPERRGTALAGPATRKDWFDMSASARPAAVDRVDRAANPALLLAARLCLVRRRGGVPAAAGRIRGQGGVAGRSPRLAIFGVFSILLYAFGQSAVRRPRRPLRHHQGDRRRQQRRVDRHRRRFAHHLRQ